MFSDVECLSYQNQQLFTTQKFKTDWQLCKFGKNEKRKDSNHKCKLYTAFPYGS